MHKIIYLIKRIFSLNYKQMFKIAKKISKKTKKNRLSIVIDMIKCGFTYGAGYYDYQEFEFYLLNKEQRKTYLTRGINNEIVRKYNDKEVAKKFDNKVIFNNIFKDFIKRDYLFLNNNLEEFRHFIKEKEQIIIKPVDGEGGKGVEKINPKEFEYKDLYNKLIQNKQELIEDVIVQNEEMNKIYKKSVNTLRMFTFVKDGKAYFLQAILKFGNGSICDNFSSGGMYTFVNDEGIVIVPAIDQEDHYFEFHPVTKEKIIGFKVPMFKEAVELVTKAALVLPEVRYVGWDVAISENGPIIVEGNWFPGVFQIKPTFNETKEGILVKYKKYMDI